MKTQLFGCNDESSAYREPIAGIRYWVETKAPSKQVLMRYAPYMFRARAVLEAPVIILLTDKRNHVSCEYLNASSSEEEIEAFTRRFELTEQQNKWCFTALEEISPVEEL